MKWADVTLSVAIFAVISMVTASPRPHIILIVADDLGWNDVSFHGSTQIPTPNIDALAYNGIILNNYYVSPICTPTRGALLSGRHPIHTGLQHSVIFASQPYGLPLNETILPQHLAKLGYRRHMVGKWHLGFHRKEFTPLYRGFESHYGYYLGCGDYYDHTSEADEEYFGYDFWKNESVDLSGIGQYSTTLFQNEAINIIQKHDADEPLFLYLPFQAVHSGNLQSGNPLQAPSSYVKKFSDIKNTKRRTFAGMVSALDDAVGAIADQLAKKNMFNNSIIVFTTDNGGPANGFDGNAASNFPLRGVKATLWEGGVRGVGFISSPLLKTSGYVSEQMIHVTDWLPTLYSAAGGNSTDIKVTDGLDLWKMLQTNGESVRTELLHNIDPLSKKAAIRVGDYKLLVGKVDMTWGGWYPPWQDPEDSCGGLGDSLQTKNLGTDRFVENFYIKNTRDKIPQRLLKGTPVMVQCGDKPVNVSTNCDPQKSPCLYHIPSDPCEYHNIADSNKDIVGQLINKLASYYGTMVAPLNTPPDPAGNPKNNGGIWKPWLS